MTVAVAFGIVAIPVIDTCSGDPRGVVTCLRDLADRKFNLPGTIQPSSAARVPEVPPMDARASEPKPAVVADVPPNAIVAQPAVPAAPKLATDTARTEPSAATEPVEIARADTKAPPAGQGGPLAPARIDPGLVEAAPLPMPGTPAAPTEPHVATTSPVEPMTPATPAQQPTVAVVPAPVLPEPAPPQPPKATTWAPVEPMSSPASAPTPPLAAEAEVDATEGEPAAPSPAPPVAAPLVLAPTIEAIELNEASSIVSGAGPAGALMRLYADGELIGETSVEEGRWMIEADDLLSVPKRLLRVEAIEPKTGKVLGDAAIMIEIELPSTPAAPTAPATDAPPATPPAIKPDGPPAVAPDPEADAPAAPALEPAPNIVAEPQSPGTRDTVAATTELPPAQEPTTVVVDRPDAPALIADLSVPEPRTRKKVTMLELLPFGDPEQGRFTGGKVTVRPGDTLWSIAHRHYGSGIHYRTILKANRHQIRRASLIYPGQVLVLPLVTEE